MDSFRYFPEFFWFYQAFLKIDGFSGTHGTRSKGAPEDVWVRVLLFLSKEAEKWVPLNESQEITSKIPSSLNLASFQNYIFGHTIDTYVVQEYKVKSKKRLVSNICICLGSIKGGKARIFSGLISEAREPVRGHSKTTLTIFASILTTYLPLVDIFT